MPVRDEFRFGVGDVPHPSSLLCHSRGRADLCGWGHAVDVVAISLELFAEGASVPLLM
jgi:hypothetical protein